MPREYTVSGEDLRAINQLEREKAYELYGGASRPSELATQQMRGEALEQAYGGLGVGGLAARGATQAAGRASYGAGVEGTRMGSADRLRASDAAIMAQARQAQYEQGIMQAYMDLLKSTEAAEATKGATDRYRAEQNRAMTQQLVGGLIGASGAAIGAGGTYGGQSQYYGGAGGQQGTAKQAGQAYGQSSYEKLQQEAENPYLEQDASSYYYGLEGMGY